MDRRLGGSVRMTCPDCGKEYFEIAGANPGTRCFCQKDFPSVFHDMGDHATENGIKEPSQ